MATKLSIKKIREELEILKTLDEKRNLLENYLKKVKSAKLKSSIQKLLNEVSGHLEHEKKFIKDELEQKLVTGTPSSTAIAAEETIAARGFELPETIKYIPRRESQLEQTTGAAVITPAQVAAEEQRKYIRTETFSAMYTEARVKIDSFKEYLTKDLGMDLRSVGRDPMITREVEDHMSKIFGLNTVSIQDHARLKNYVNMLLGKPEDVMKYKR